MGRDSAVGTDWTVRGLNPGGGKIFRPNPYQRWGPHNIFYNGNCVFFPDVKRPRHGLDHPPQSSAEDKESVELHIYSPFGFSWCVKG